ETICISTETDNYEVDNNTLRFNPDSIVEVLTTYNDIYEGAKSYHSKYVNYKSREFQRSYFDIQKERKTLSSKGEFTFLIDRFNLDTKRTKKDFEKYLNENDLVSLQDLTLKLIQKEVFGSEFLT